MLTLTTGPKPNAGPVSAAQTPPQQVDARLQLGDTRLRHCWAARHPSQLSMDDAVRLSAALRPHAHKAVQKRALLLEVAIERHDLGVNSGLVGLALPVTDSPGLALVTVTQ